MTTVPAPIVTIRDIAIGYTTGGSRNLLFENINLQLNPSEFVCFMGPNGIGKSTLLRTLAGLHKPFSGTVAVSRSSEKTPLSQQVSVVLTDKIAAMNMTVFELVSFGRYPYMNWNVTLSEHDLQIVRAAIGQVHIHDLVEKKLFELSDGQLQMVMIARALAQDTPVMLLDEPTAHLDLNNRLEIMKLLRNLAHTTGKAIVVSTHELDLALQTADYIWLAGKNKNILTGIPEDLVLNGAFDTIFQFKGYDLKTGKVQHTASLGRSVAVKGNDAEYLWTKNALVRTGFEILETASLIITVRREGDRHSWIVSDDRSFYSLHDLLIFLLKQSGV
jgi:iron complex transport system ATP-binding protein